MKYVLKMLQYTIQSIISTFIICAIGLGPSLLYAAIGGENEDIDMLCRGVGFLLVLFLMVYVCNPKRKDNESDQ